MSAIPYGRQDINQADIDAVVAVLRSDFLTHGPAAVKRGQLTGNSRFAEQVEQIVGRRIETRGPGRTEVPPINSLPRVTYN